jgi:hypothetical protein
MAGLRGVIVSTTSGSMAACQRNEQTSNGVPARNSEPARRRPARLRRPLPCHALQCIAVGRRKRRDGFEGHVGGVEAGGRHGHVVDEEGREAKGTLFNRSSGSSGAATARGCWQCRQAC